jgi:hypothetical protein
LIEDIDEFVCMSFDNDEPRSERRMILALLVKIRELIAEINDLKLKTTNGGKC